MTIQVKAIEQSFHVVPFIILYKGVLTFNSLNKTLVYDLSNESFEQFFRMRWCISFYCMMYTSVDETLVCGYLNESQ